MNSFLLYNGRHGEQILTPHDEKHWLYLIEQLEEDNRMTIAECDEQGLEVYGCPDYHVNANISVDDGGEIHTLELSELD